MKKKFLISFIISYIITCFYQPIVIADMISFKKLFFDFTNPALILFYITLLILGIFIYLNAMLNLYRFQRSEKKK